MLGHLFVAERETAECAWGVRLLIWTWYSYPRLTLDFHTNKRIIDEVVRIIGG